MELLLQHLTVLSQAIGNCLARKQHLPSLILIYAGIDIVASVEAKNGERVQEYFRRWVDSYLLPTKLINCTSLDLYAARCGIVHTMTAESDLARSGKARMVYYAWGNSEANELDETFARLKKDDLIVAVHIDRLYEAFRIGVLAWEDEVRKDVERLKRVENHNKRWFTNTPSSLVKDFLSIPQATKS